MSTTMRSGASVRLCVILVVICLCLCDVVLSRDFSGLNRSKRGFRQGSASRVAHGYGKRAYGSPTDGLSPYSGDLFIGTPASMDEFDDGSLMSVREFSNLVASHPNLAQALVRKFVDVDGDDVISKEELFRPVMKK